MDGVINIGGLSRIFIVTDILTILGVLGVAGVTSHITCLKHIAQRYFHMPVDLLYTSLRFKITNLCIILFTSFPNHIDFSHEI